MLLFIDHLLFWSSSRPISRLARIGLRGWAWHQVLGSRNCLVTMLAGVGDRDQLKYPVHLREILGVSTQDVVYLTHGPEEVHVDGGAGLGRGGKVEEQIVGPEEANRDDVEQTGCSPLFLGGRHLNIILY